MPSDVHTLSVRRHAVHLVDYLVATLGMTAKRASASTHRPHSGIRRRRRAEVFAPLRCVCAVFAPQTRIGHSRHWRVVPCALFVRSGSRAGKRRFGHRLLGFGHAQRCPSAGRGYADFRRRDRDCEGPRKGRRDSRFVCFCHEPFALCSTTSTPLPAPQQLQNSS